MKNKSVPFTIIGYMKLIIAFLIASLCCQVLASDQIFLGKPIESHVYRRPLSLEKLTEIGVPNPKAVYEEIEDSNSCGVEIVKLEVTKPLLGNPDEIETVYDTLGEWCYPRFQMGTLSLFHLVPKFPYSHILEYDFIIDAKHGLVIPGPGHSGMGFYGVAFREGLVSLTQPYLAGRAEDYDEWKQAIEHKEIVFEGGNAYITTGVVVAQILEREVSNKSIQPSANASAD